MGTGNKLMTSAIRTASAVLARAGLSNLVGTSFGGLRNMYEVFGYPRTISPEQALFKYQRQDIASRAIDAPPDAVWSKPPVIMNEPLQVKMQELSDTIKLWSMMHRADRLSRLNPFSLLVLGFDKGALDSPAQKGSKLLYIRPVSARYVQSIKLTSDAANANYGKPEMYSIDFARARREESTSGTISVTSAEMVKNVHHSRVIHIVESALEDDIFGTPIINKIYNVLEDIFKVTGGTAETYWMTSNRGMQADIDKDIDLDPEDAKELKDEIEEYQHQLRRIIRTRGVKITPLGAQSPSPKEAFEMAVAVLSGTTGIPQRILLGNEAGQLASEQDRANWSDRVSERRVLFAEPVMLTPFIKRMQEYCAWPEGAIAYEWPSAFILSPLEAAQTMAQKARAVGNLSRQTGNAVPMQITSEEEARVICGLKGELPEGSRVKIPVKQSSTINNEPANEDKDEDADRKIPGPDE